MRIGFDLRPFLREETGVGIYLKNLLYHLALIDKTNEYFLFSASWKDRFPAKKIPILAKMKFSDKRIPVKALNYFWYKWRWPPLDHFFKTALDLTHSATPLLLPTRGKKIVTVCDLFFMESPGQAGKEAGRTFFTKAAGALRRADGVITISSFTRDELVARFSLEANKVRVIPLGLDRQFLEEAGTFALEEVKKKYNLPSSFLLFVGAQEPRKNLLRLVEALKIVHLQGQQIALALVGPPGEDSNRLLVQAEKLGLAPWLIMTDYLPEEEVRSIYRLATVFVFPSLCEGFGLPLIEAMASGVPVAASFSSAIPEVCRDAALYFRPKDPEGMAEKILFLLKSSQAREELVAKGKKRAQDFSWEKTAAETLKFYQSLGEK
jgi:glycosyltransferase involved in cell wall biosynthesis